MRPRNTMQLRHFNAIYRDGTVLRERFDDPDRPYNGTMDTAKVVHYLITGEDNRVVYGVDVDRRTLIVNGTVVRTDLPDGEYQLLAFKRVELVSDGTRHVSYAFGLHGEVGGKNHKRVVFVHEDDSVTFASKT